MVNRSDEIWNNVGLLVLRVGAGLLLALGHGWPKLVHFAERSRSFADPLGFGSGPSLALVVFTEVLCATLVGIGWLTRLSTIPILIFLAVAAFVQHAHDPWARKELALIFAVPYLAILFAGPGRYSIDAGRAARRDPRPLRWR